MTDGTSQGLFVVVAIVIFGIFVALSYTVFGSDGLSGGITNLFEESVIMTKNSVEKYEDVNFSIAPFHTGANQFETHSLTSNSIEYTSDGSGLYGTGVSISPSFLDFDSEYLLTFDMEVISGNVSTIGGHLHISDKQDSYVNGSKLSTRWASRSFFPEDTNKVSVEVYFNTDYLVELESGSLRGTYNSTENSPYYGAGLTLTSNRWAPDEDREEHRVRIDNIRIQRKQVH